jgi:hypothetical protein
VCTLESDCETSEIVYQKQRRAERKVSNKEFNTNQHSTAAKQKATASIWPVPSILTRKAPISAEKQADIRSMLKYMPPIDAECLQSVLSNNAVVQSVAKVGNKNRQRVAQNE